MSKRLVLGLCVLSVAATSNTQSFGLVFARVAEALGLTLPQLGGLRTLESGAAIIVALAVAPLVDQFPRKWVLLTGYGLALVGLIALVALNNVVGLVVFFLLNGGSVMLAFGALMATPGDFLSGRALNRVMGLVIGSLAFTSIIIAPIVGRVSDAYDWRGGMIASGVVVLLALAVTLMLVPRYRLPTESADLPGFVERYRSIAGNGLLLAVLGTALLRFAQFAGLVTFLSAVLIERYDLSLSAIGLVFALAGIVFFVSSVGSSALLHALKTRRVLGHGGFVASGLFLALYLVDPGVGGMIVGIAAVTAVLASQEAASTLAVLRLSLEQRGAAMSYNELMAGVGSLIGIGAASLGYQLAGIQGIGVALMGFAVAAGIGSLIVIRRAGDLESDDAETGLHRAVSGA